MPTGERYQEFAPPPALSPFVRLVWTYAAPSTQGGVQRIPPDGCPELIFDIAEPYEEQEADGVFRPQPRVIFAGQMTRPMAIRATGPIEVVGLRFHPDGARDWLGAPLTTATDLRLDMTQRLADLSPPSGRPERQADMLIARLEADRLAGDWRLDDRVRAEVQAIEAGQTASERGEAEQRALQRRFADRVGVPPRALRSILRFRSVFGHVDMFEDGGVNWLEAGLDAGYFDQPQMARDFRRFLGCTATEWARDQVELARRVASEPYKSATIEAR